MEGQVLAAVYESAKKGQSHEEKVTVIRREEIRKQLGTRGGKIRY